ncbi:MAG: hypothetical protein HeimC2_36360 [Candidatus Heimdallarchaeota archaeon LC_2]|nr:MAG: hypothetical protein HeimC2_36360 [Candidatus Heimdallarchaeota archaeon LC_2]
MQGDEIAPAEFLLGKLASDFLKVHTPPLNLTTLTKNGIRKFNLIISSLLLLELLLGILIIANLTVTRRLNYIVIFLLLLRIIIIAKKNTSLTHRYAPDLASHSYIKFSFSFVQLLLSSAVLLVFSISIFIFKVLTPELELLDENKLILFVIVIFYINVVSDLALVALGKGVGIFGQSHRIKTLVHNISELSKIKGKQSTQLAILRSANWILVYYFLVNIQITWLLTPYVIISFYYMQKWEKVNSSSLFMEIRSEIAMGKPAMLPHKLFMPQEQSIDSNEGNFTINESSVSKQFLNYQKKPGKNPLRNNKLQNLGAIAAQSLSKIAEIIKEEENVLPSNLTSYCNNCNMEVINSRNFCSYCGERNQQF